MPPLPRQRLPASRFPCIATSARFTLSEPGLHDAANSLSGFAPSDGTYDLQYSAQSFANLLEPRHTSTLILDNTPPVTTITQPAATQYVHSAILTLSYTVSDGSGSGVQSFTPKMDGATTLPNGTGLANGQMIRLLTDLTLGTHTFSVDSIDNVSNAGTKLGDVPPTSSSRPIALRETCSSFCREGTLRTRAKLTLYWPNWNRQRARDLEANA